MHLRWRFICHSVDCRPEIEIALPLSDGDSQASELCCSTGVPEMKKAYSRPVVRKLSKAEAWRKLGRKGLNDLAGDVS
jgi:hypothetical protein